VEQLEQLYLEQEGLMEEAIEHIIIEDNGVDSSDGSDTSECGVLSGVEELEGN
jgi:hypothetical protein